VASKWFRPTQLSPPCSRARLAFATQPYLVRVLVGATAVECTRRKDLGTFVRNILRAVLRVRVGNGASTWDPNGGDGRRSERGGYGRPRKTKYPGAHRVSAELAGRHRGTDRERTPKEAQWGQVRHWGYGGRV